MSQPQQKKYEITDDELKVFSQQSFSCEAIVNRIRSRTHTSAPAPEPDEQYGEHQCICHWSGDSNIPPCSHSHTSDTAPDNTHPDRWAQLHDAAIEGRAAKVERERAEGLLKETLIQIGKEFGKTPHLHTYAEFERRYLAAIRSQQEPPAQCTWAEDEDGIYQTSCGHAFELISGEAPNRQGILYCPYCGKPINQQEAGHE